MEKKTKDVAAAMFQLWELRDNIIAAHEISDQIVRECTEGSPNLLRASAILRMTMSWLVITLWKIHELWQRYAYLASEDTKRKMGAVDKEILARNIKRVRNTIAAHLLDKDTKDPVPPSQVFSELQSVWKNDVKQFLIWLVGLGSGKESVQGCLAAFLEELGKSFPGVMQEMMLSEQKKTVGYPAGLPTKIGLDGKIIE